MKNGLALVPIQTGQQLEHHLARTLAQAGAAVECRVDNAFNGVNRIGAQTPHVHCERVSFALQEYTVDSGNGLPESLLRAVQVGNKCGAAFH